MGVGGYFVLIDERCGAVLRGEGANVDECCYPLVGTGRCNDSATIRMANENNRPVGAGERRPDCGRVVGDCVEMVLRRYDLETIGQKTRNDLTIT
jgi:hypothetical protein